MTYNPITPEEKAKWTAWLQSQVSVLNNKPENKDENSVFETPDGDVATGKDLVGNLLATLSEQPVTIN